MEFGKFLERLNKLAEENPKVLKLVVVTSCDDEGNGFNKVHYEPSVGHYEDGDFQGEDGCINAVCVN